jgi:DNA (cytosine-5)-methyltransferase 1
MALNAKAGKCYDGESETFVTHSLRADGFDASEDGTGRGTPLVPIGFYGNDFGGDAVSDGFPTLRSMANGGGAQPAIAFRASGQDGFTPSGITPPVSNTDGGGAGVPTIVGGMAVRRLTPLECERLMGMPDGYTAIQYRGKPAADGPRYRAIGNSMAVPVMSWIGRRIISADTLGGAA